MIRRIEREPAFPPRRLGVARRNLRLEPVVEDLAAPELALRYSNGFVTVEISHDAVDAYVEANGDVPLPVYVDPETGDRRSYDARSRVRVVYDREARLREVTSRGRDGLYVRLTVLPSVDGPDGGGDDALRDVADQERDGAERERAAEVVDEEGVQPQDAGHEDDAGAQQDRDEAPQVAAAEAEAEQGPGGVGGDREADEIAAGGGERPDEARDPAEVALEHR